MREWETREEMAYQGRPHREGMSACDLGFVLLVSKEKLTVSMPCWHHLGWVLGHGPGRSPSIFAVSLGSFYVGSWSLELAGSMPQHFR